jgi:hypothetical protein
MSRQTKLPDCSNPPLTPRNGQLQADGRHAADCDCAWRVRVTRCIPETGGTKDSWRIVYRYIRTNRGRQAANLLLTMHAKKKITCPACGLIETPKLSVSEYVVGAETRAHIGASCAGCGKWMKWMKQGGVK